MPDKSFGTPMTVNQYIEIGGDAEIAPGHWGYVRNNQQHVADDIPDYIWNPFLAGDMTTIKTSIESRIAGSEVTWARIHWDKAEPYNFMGTPVHRVYGFWIEALVQNKSGAGLTGLEIVAIIMAVAFLAIIAAIIALGAWLTWEVMNAAKQLGPAVTIGVGLLLLGGIGILAFVFLGGAFTYKGKKRRVSIGQRKRD